MLLDEMKKLGEGLEVQSQTHVRELEELPSEWTWLRGLEARPAAVEARTSAATAPTVIAGDSR